jgi:N,N'-diacetyllegionaminate synthase
MLDKILIIAEAGVNHNGSVSCAKEMVKLAKEAGCDAVNFQTFKAEEIVTEFALKASYQKEEKDETQLKMLKSLELSDDEYKQLFDYCREIGILFMSTPFDSLSVDLLTDLGMTIFKIPSGEITNLPYLRKIGSLKKEVILSTGMSDICQIEEVLNILIESGTPKSDISLLHCNTAYPTPFEDANLAAINTLKKKFKVNVGFSDHTSGIEAAIAAAALGAKIIEKHFTLDKNMKGPDHKASLDPKELEVMVKSIRNIEKAVGSVEKKVSLSEEENILAVRKSIVASVFIEKGEIFTSLNITAKRPASGISPLKWDEVLGATAKKEFKKDEQIEL